MVIYREDREEKGDKSKRGDLSRGERVIYREESEADISRGQGVIYREKRVDISRGKGMYYR